MPIISIHEEVALLITQKYKDLDTSDFYLGAMAPDSVNLEFFAPKEDRWTTHLRKKDLTDWRLNLRKYYERCGGSLIFLNLIYLLLYLRFLRFFQDLIQE